MDGSGIEEALVGVLEPTEPWTIKAFSRTLRLAAVNAARLEGVTTGQWLERCVRDRLECGSQSAPRAESKGVNLGELAQIYQQAQALAAAAGVPVPPSVARSALALTRRAARQVEGVQPYRRVLPPPASSKSDAG